MVDSYNMNVQNYQQYHQEKQNENKKNSNVQWQPQEKYLGKKTEYEICECSKKMSTLCKNELQLAVQIHNYKWFLRTKQNLNCYIQAR